MKLIGKRKQDGVGRVTLRFDGDITIYTVKKLKKVLFDELNKCKSLILDLSGVSLFDSAGFQLLLVASRKAGTEGRELVIREKSGQVQSILDLYGVSWK